MPKTTMYEANPNHRRKTRGEPYYQTLSSWFPKVEFVPHPSTEPGTIRRRHATECRAAKARRPDATPEEIAEDLYLPLWNVCRALGVPYSPPPKPDRDRGERSQPNPPSPEKNPNGRGPGKKRLAASAAVLELLSSRPAGMLMKEIVWATGIDRGTLWNMLHNDPNFRKTQEPTTGGRPAWRWFRQLI